MAEYEVTLSKRTSNNATNNILYPKTKSTLVKHGNSTVSVVLTAATTDINKLKNAILVTAIADMVDTTKLYVYDGHFYEWDSSTSQWTERGVAGGSTLELASTLTSADTGKAADAAVVDARIAPIEAVIDSFNFQTDEFLSFIVNDGENNVIFQVDDSGNANFAGDIGADGAIFTDNVKVKSLTVATGNNSPVASISNTGAVSGASLSMTGAASAASVTTTGDITVGGDANITGDIEGASLSITGAVSAASVTTSGNGTIGGTLAVTSSISGASVSVSGAVNAGSLTIGDPSVAAISSAGAISGASLSLTGAASAASITTSGNGTIGGTLDVTGAITSPTITTLQSDTTKLKNAILASSSSDMVDTTKLYILNGHYYEHLNNQWTQLGVAGASMVEIANTLTSSDSGKAADAAVVGARFSSLETVVDSLVLDFETNEFLSFIVRDENSNVIFQVDNSGNTNFAGDLGADGAIFTDNVTVKSLTVATGNNSPVAGISNAGAITGSSISVTGNGSIGGDLSVTGSITSPTITSIQSKTDRFSTQESGYAYAILDSSSNVVFGVATNGSVSLSDNISAASFSTSGNGSVGGALSVTGAITSPTITALQDKTNRLSTSSSGYDFAILDSNENVTFGVDSSGNITTAGDISSTNVTTIESKLQRVGTPTSSIVFKVVDTAGNPVMYITNDGNLLLKGTVTASNTSW